MFLKLKEKEILECKQCNKEFIRYTDSKTSKEICDSCLLDEAWRDLILILEKKIRLNIFIEWLYQKLEKVKWLSK